jgi:hypothetical protein
MLTKVEYIAYMKRIMKDWNKMRAIKQWRRDWANPKIFREKRKQSGEWTLAVQKPTELNKLEHLTQGQAIGGKAGSVTTLANLQKLGQGFVGGNMKGFGGGSSMTKQLTRGSNSSRLESSSVGSKGAASSARNSRAGDEDDVSEDLGEEGEEEDQEDDEEGDESADEDEDGGEEGEESENDVSENSEDQNEEKGFQTEHLSDFDVDPDSEQEGRGRVKRRRVGSQLGNGFCTSKLLEGTCGAESRERDAIANVCDAVVSCVQFASAGAG